MGRRARPPKSPPIDYRDREGNILSLRPVLKAGSRQALLGHQGTAAATSDDAWRRRQEMLFERLVVSWQIAGLEPLTKQQELLARYRMSAGAERDWVAATIRAHVVEHFPELQSRA